jgi:hypothetical protein
MKAAIRRPLFSDRLDVWLHGGGPKTIAGLQQVFGRKSLAIAITLLMILPATPIPTGGLSHVFEIIATVLALELVLGFRGIWLPRRWMHATMPERITRRAIPFVLRLVRRYEAWSSPRGKRIFSFDLTNRLAGLVLLVLAPAAFVAPPFTGIDTLSALGAVLVGLALTLEDAVLLGLGILFGAVGVALVVIVGAVVVTFIRHLV